MQDNNQNLFDKYNEMTEEGKSSFHYQRADRISHASRIVQQEYDGTGLKPPSGIFEALVHTKSSRMMLIILVATVAITLFIGFFGASPSEGSIAGIPVSATAFTFEDTIYISVKFSEKEDFGESVQVHANVALLDSDNQTVDEKQIDGFYQGKEFFLRTTNTDYDILKVRIEVLVSGETRELTVPVTKQ